jgi:hypothetical protein
MATANLDPRAYFKFKSCGRCLQKPCDRLRFGRVYNGKFILVHTRMLGAGLFDCPFVAQDPEEVETLLQDTPLLELIDHIDGLLSDLSVNEQMMFDQASFVKGYDDFAGRVRFLRAMWDEQVFGMVRVPLFFVNKEMTKWLYANESLDYTLKNDMKPEREKPAVTDSMANQPAAQQESAAPKQEKKKVEKGPFHIRLNIDPNDESSQDDTFTMFSTDAAKSYNKVLTVKDDQVPGDSYTDLSFPDLDKSLSYSMKIDLGSDGNSYILFENKPYGELNG